MGILGKRGDLEWDTLIPWIIAIVVLALMIFLYMTGGDVIQGWTDRFKTLWRFGR